jgi:hypothetical protein
MTTMRAPVLRPAWLLARQTIASRAGVAIVVGFVGLDLLARSALPFGIAASHARADELGRESRVLLFGTITLLTLLRASRWRPILHGLGDLGVAATVCLSALYLDCIAHLSVGSLDALLFRADPRPEWLELGAGVWLATLAGILALSRLEPRALGLVFLLLAWWVPVLGLPGPDGGGALGEGISRTPWSAEGILPMLVPHLWAVGYVCLERAQR